MCGGGEGEKGEEDGGRGSSYSLCFLLISRGGNSLSFEFASNLDANLARKARGNHLLQAGPPFLHAGERKGV